MNKFIGVIKINKRNLGICVLIMLSSILFSYTPFLLFLLSPLVIPKETDIKIFGNRIFTDRFLKGFYKGQKGNGFPMEPKLRQNLDIIKDSVLNYNNDWFMVIDGANSLGKTTKSFQVALYLDPNFNISKVCFTPEQFLKVIEIAKKGDAIILDEAIMLFSRSAMSEWNKKVIIAMSQIRSKNLFIIFNLPSIFNLDSNLTLWRCQLLLHCWSPSFGKKGHFKAYFQKEIKTLYLLGKKYYSYRKPNPNFMGTFSSCFILNEKEYEKKKQISIFSLLKKTSVKSGYRERNLMIKYLRKEGKSYSDISKICEGLLGEDAIGKICRGERGDVKDFSDELVQSDKGGEQNE